MKKILFLIALIITQNLQAQALEDCIITTNGQLTDIQIENNTIIDVFPLITVLNEKNTLIVHPLKTGITCFTVIKNLKEKALFHVKVTETETLIKEVDGYDIFSLDIPPDKESFELDLPPKIKGGE